MDFRIAGAAREHYGLDESVLGSGDEPGPMDPARARRFAMRMALAGGSRPERPVHAGDIDAIGLIHEMQHQMVNRASSEGDRPFASVLRQLQAELGTKALDDTLAGFEDTFPSAQVWAGADARAYLEGATDGVPNRELDLEEMLLLWVANQNPAFMAYGELFDETSLGGGAYAAVIAGIRRNASLRAGTDDGDLADYLLAPVRASPSSLGGQLAWIQDHTPEVVGADVGARLSLSLDILAEEEMAAQRAWQRNAGNADGGHGPPGGYLGGDEEYEGFTRDRDWMPSVVLMAKSTYVWLDQLSQAYGRPIWTLDGIPDEELDRLRDAGITGLWLIGLWERSHASQQIKQLRGNPEAVASAYSLMDYRISDDLGGDKAYENLRGRAWERGIRLASDMVPNHMGIDSRWVVEHPEWFLQRSDSPFPSYSFNGPNLSQDERVGIYLEDHYLDNSDAAVVFKRKDRWSGNERFIYHGNDGTSFPWNDTAQLDYLNPETREAVIQTILAVARRSPIIRFDAAMTLARRHVQRLWYPLPGHGGAIPSRAESAMPQAEFDRNMPHEFWREVVDRVAREVPDTLLLAEAFWMLEGYFVRTLGMHRVYNSAFMHMLRDERNAEYRAVIRETLDFDPEILKRYVNFMNNPDERTAIDQFGDGDKYFGVATMLATLPGLPMLGHGQVEGFSEKYGMEFRRAVLDETPNHGLVQRHQREIFPLLRQRWRFAEARDFGLHDFRTDAGVDPNVFAYSNGRGEERSLIVFHNRHAEIHGCVAGIAPQLGVTDQSDHWLLLRDHPSGLEFIRNAHDVHVRGLELDLRAYQRHAFLSFEEVADGPEREWARLAWRLGLAGVPDAQAALSEQRMEPLAAAVARFLDGELLRRLSSAVLGHPDKDTQATLKVVMDLLGERLRDVVAEAPAGVDQGAVASTAAVLRDRLRFLAKGVGRAHADGRSDGDRALAGWLDEDALHWSTLLGWLLADSVLALGGSGRADRADALERWGVDRALHAACQALCRDEGEASRSVQLVRALLARATSGGSFGAADASIPAGWFEDPDVRLAAGWNEHDGRSYVNREASVELLEALAAREALLGSTASFAVAGRRAEEMAARGYRVSEGA